AHALQNAVELPRPHLRTARQRQSKRMQEFAQRFLLGERGRIVDAKNERLLLAFQRLGGRDIGLDHELFDELVGVEALRDDNTVDGAVRLEQYLAFRQLEFQRLAGIAAALQRGIGIPQRPENAVEDRPRLV